MPITRSIAGLAAAAALIGCGGDEETSQPRSTPAAAEPSGLGRAASELTTYLREETKGMTSSSAKPGQLVNLVEPFETKLKIYLVASAEIARDDKLADQVCGKVADSGIAEAQDALVVDIGDAAMGNC
jgi:hypothetical protein